VPGKGSVKSKKKTLLESGITVIISEQEIFGDKSLTRVLKKLYTLFFGVLLSSEYYYSERITKFLIV